MIPMRDGVKLNTHHFHAEEGRAALAFPAHAHSLRRPRIPSAPDVRILRGTRRRGLHLRLPGHPRALQVRGSNSSCSGRRATSSDPRAIDESTDAYDTDRMAAQERPRPQRARRHDGHLLRRLADGDGDARSASGREGRVAAGLARGHVPRRRLPPQRGLPAELRLRVRGHDGNIQGKRLLPVRRATTPTNGTCGSARCPTVNEKYLLGKIPTWNDFVDHPNYDEFWQKQAMAPYLTRVTVPTLNVAGWWDQEDFYGPQKIYETLEPLDSTKHELPRRRPVESRRLDAERREHARAGSSSEPTPRSISGRRSRRRGSPTGSRTRGTWDVPEAVTFETGSNDWQIYDEWPPRNLTEDRNLYFREDGRLSFEAPAARTGGRSTATSPIRPTRSPTGPGRSSRPTTRAARAGGPGSSETSGSSTCGRTC